MSDFQDNPEGLKVGDKVKVVAQGLTFFHIMKHKEGYDPEGGVGEIKNIILWSDKFDSELTANRPVLVSFTVSSEHGPE
ncbi:unnamed protein product [Discosporangium mesarthrocarpum]